MIRDFKQSTAAFSFFYSCDFKSILCNRKRNSIINCRIHEIILVLFRKVEQISSILCRNFQVFMSNTK